MIEESASSNSAGGSLAGGDQGHWTILCYKAFKMLKYVLPLKMFQQQNGLVVPVEVSPSTALSWVTRLKTDI